MTFDKASFGKPTAHKARDTFNAENVFYFGPFVLYAQQYLLLKNGETVQLGSRAILLLITLVSRAGELVDKNELLSLVWPKVIVEECNLRAQMVALRRALDDDEDGAYIATVPRRGYRFVAPVTTQEAMQQLAPVPTQAVQCDTEIFQICTSVIGRDQLLTTLAEQLLRLRFVTITGTGGIGKTTVALALAKHLSTHFPHGMAFLDLAQISGGTLVNGMLASALGIKSVTNSPLQDIGNTRVDSRQLLILDNCEHVLEESANAVETILRQMPQCCVLVTSREPLYAEGELVHELAPLEVPANDLDACSSQALNYSSIQLFIDRVRAYDPDFIFQDIDVHSAAAICRKLDGNPLAIEIAAARVRTFGLNYLVTLLDGIFRLQMTGRRTAKLRHRTLRATLDWTYTILSDSEQAMLRQLSVFTAPFTLDAAQAVIDINLQASQNLPSLLESLKDKSLLTGVDYFSIKRYRLLETTRLYAAEKLSLQMEASATAHRHAVYTLNVQQNAVKDFSSMSLSAWLASYSPEIDSVRAALNWAYSSDGDQALGIELTLTSAMLWLRLSLVSEYHNWVDRALQVTEHLASDAPRQRMLLLATSANVMTLAYGAGQKIRDTWKLVNEDACTLGDTEYELRALWGLWSDRCCANQYQEALELANCYLQRSESSNSMEGKLVSKHVLAGTLFYMGDLKGAQQRLAEALSSPLSSSTHLIDIYFDRRSCVRSFNALIQLLQGNVAQALLSIDSAIEEDIATSQLGNLCYTLCAIATPITLVVKHEQKSRAYLKLLRSTVDRQGLHLWDLFTRCFESILLIRDNNPEEGVPRLGEVLNQMDQIGGTPFYSFARSEYALGLAALGLIQQGLDILNETLHTCEARKDLWYHPELMRIKAQLLLGQDDPASQPLAHEILHEAMAEAESQGACFWTMRIAADLASLSAPQQIK